MMFSILFIINVPQRALLPWPAAPNRKTLGTNPRQLFPQQKTSEAAATTTLVAGGR